MDNEPVSSSDDQLDSTILVAIVVGCSGFLLMVLGIVFYLSRLGDVPSALRKPTESPETPSTRDDANTPRSAATPNAGFMTPGANNNTPQIPNDEVIEIYAPAGKLGIILDTGGNGPPTVHQIRPYSVLTDEMQIGDRIVALDDQDVQSMPANKVSKLISRKMDNATRKFTVIRTVLPDV